MEAKHTCSVPHALLHVKPLMLLSQQCAVGRETKGDSQHQKALKNVNRYLREPCVVTWSHVPSKDSKGSLWKPGNCPVDESASQRRRGALACRTLRLPRKVIKLPKYHELWIQSRSRLSRCLPVVTTHRWHYPLLGCVADLCIVKPWVYAEWTPSTLNIDFKVICPAQRRSSGSNIAFLAAIPTSILITGWNSNYSLPAGG